MSDAVKKKNWKTTAGGFLAGLIPVVVELADLVGVQIGELTNGKFDVAVLMTGLGLMGLGWFARDKNVSSEDSGAK